MLNSFAVLLCFLSLSVASKARTYLDIGVSENLSISSLGLNPIARFRSDEARGLRDSEGSLAWELRMMQGDIHQVARDTIRAGMCISNYSSYGMDMDWPAIPDMGPDHVVLGINDNICVRVWDFNSTAVCEFERRMLPLHESIPRRLTMITSKVESERSNYIETSLLDEKVFQSLQSFPEDWARAMVRSSTFQRADVKQIIAILKECDGQCTPRLQCDTCPNCKIRVQGYLSGDFPSARAEDDADIFLDLIVIVINCF